MIINDLFNNKKRDIAEGRFVRGPGGVPLDRQGRPVAPKAPKAEPMRMRQWIVHHNGQRGEGGTEVIEAPNLETAWELANEYDLDIIDIKPAKGVAETNVSKYKDLGATKNTTHFIKNVTTGKIVSPHRSRQDAEDALVASMRDSNDEFKIVRARKQGVAEGKKPDSYHIVNKDGKPATLASYADRASAEKDRDAKHPGAEVRQLGPRGKVKNVSEVSLGDYRKKATLDKALAQTDRFFGRDDAAKVAAADQTIAKREKGLARADARIKPYTPPPAAPADLEKQQRDLTAKYPNIDELVRRAELNRDPDYEMADGQAYYAARDAEQNYLKLKQIQRVIQGLNESLNRSHLP